MATELEQLKQSVFITLTRSLTNNFLSDAATNAYLAECGAIAGIKKKLNQLKILVIKQGKVPAVAQCICSIITRKASVCALFNDALPASVPRPRGMELFPFCTATVNKTYFSLLINTFVNFSVCHNLMIEHHET